jgi:hypothetical protein
MELIKKTNITAVILITITFSIVLTGCTEEQPNTDEVIESLIGTWEDQKGGSLTFNEDDTVIISEIAQLREMELEGLCDFVIKDKNIMFTNNIRSATFIYKIIAHKTLEIEDASGEILNFTKLEQI